MILHSTGPTGSWLNIITVSSIPAASPNRKTKARSNETCPPSVKPSANSSSCIRPQTSLSSTVSYGSGAPKTMANVSTAPPRVLPTVTSLNKSSPLSRHSPRRALKPPSGKRPPSILITISSSIAKPIQFPILMSAGRSGYGQPNAWSRFTTPTN